MEISYIELTKRGFSRLSSNGKRSLVLYLVSQVFIAGLDGVALFLLSKVVSQKATSVTSNQINHDYVIVILSVVSLFLLRSVLATIATYKSLQEFATQEVEIGQDNFQNLLNQDYQSKISLTEADYYTKIDRAPTSLIQGFLVSVFTAAAEVISGVVIFIVVIFMQPVTALIAVSFFIAIAVIQHKMLTSQQERAGQIVFKSGNRTYEVITDAYQLKKLLQIYPSESLEQVLKNERLNLAKARAKQSFIASLPRYFMESMLAIGFVLIAGVTWLVSGQNAIAPALVIFAAAGFRLLPIVNRIQGLVLSSIGYAPLALEAIASPAQVDKSQKFDRDFEKIENLPLDTLIRLQEISYSYPGSSTKALNEINLDIKIGKKYAIVGPSGSGKTTLVDLLLGLLHPSAGELIWNAKSERTKIGYVPQDSVLSATNLFLNIALEWDELHVDEKLAQIARDKSHLGEFEGSQSEDSHRLNMSGGQRQRVGLARAIYRDANFLILDEATSSLDSSTESKVMETVSELGSKITSVVVAHRLSTVQDADSIIYLENGNILGVGTFIELQKLVPQFAEQVRLGSLISEG